jgi:hypothetical protein
LLGLAGKQPLSGLRDEPSGQLELHILADGQGHDFESKTKIIIMTAPVTSLGGRLKVRPAHSPHFVPNPPAKKRRVIQMHDGHTIPEIGLGVYEMSDTETYSSSKWALESGYRHIDTAEWYEHERECGRALADFLSPSTSPLSAVTVYR